MTKEQFEPINVAFGEMNAALDSCMMSPAAGYRVVLAYEKVKAALQPYLKIEESTPADGETAEEVLAKVEKRIKEIHEAGCRAPPNPVMPI